MIVFAEHPESANPYYNRILTTEMEIPGDSRANTLLICPQYSTTEENAPKPGLFRDYEEKYNLKKAHQEYKGLPELLGD